MCCNKELCKIHEMKRFIDEKGTFGILIPITFNYTLFDDKLHTFHDYQLLGTDAFQLSINEANNYKVRNKFLSLVKPFSKIKIGKIFYYSYPDFIHDTHITKTWTRLIGDNIVLFTLTTKIETNKGIANKSLIGKVSLVHDIIKSFNLFDKANSSSIITYHRFETFIQGVGAAALILEKAIESKAFTEATCILANQIDALLRIGIILKLQINNNSSGIDIEWIYQGLNDKVKSEKDIYKKCLGLDIIDKTIFDELYKLYNDRNRVVHRFIISEITIYEVEQIAYRYYLMLQSIKKIIYDIESEQIKLNVGMTVASNKKFDLNLKEFVKGKIGKSDYFDNKT